MTKGKAPGFKFVQDEKLGTNEVLRVSPSGEFSWHPEAEAMIEHGDFTSTPALRHILRALRNLDEVFVEGEALIAKLKTMAIHPSHYSGLEAAIDQAARRLEPQAITDPAEIRRVFELDDAQPPDPESGFALLDRF